jgi:uncharacterized membrane protein
MRCYGCPVSAEDQSRAIVWDVFIEFSAVVDVECPAQEVWTVLADYGRDPQWRAGVLSMRAVPPGCAAVGTATVEVMRFAGRTLHNNAEIISVGPGTQLAWRTTSGVDAQGVRIVQPRGPQRCQVQLRTRVQPHGLSRALAPLVRLVLQRRITGDARRLRSLAERAGTAAP